jgi:hypothetical protein
MSGVVSKVCTACETELPISDFAPRKQSKDGYRNQCRRCRTTKHREWRESEHGAALIESWKASRQFSPKMEGTKVCSQCNKEKPITEFWKHKRYPDGRLPYCSDCGYQQHKRYRETPEGKVKYEEGKKRFFATEKGKALRKKHTRAFAKTAKGKACHRRATNKWYHTRGKPFVYAQLQRRRAAKRQAGAEKITVEQWQSVLDAFGHRCAYCNGSGKLTQDHVEPLYRGGRHVVENVVPACMSCNGSKQARLILEWVWAGPERFTGIVA